MCESLSYCLMKVVDLFCGCGGFSEGARQAGSSARIAVDNDTDCVRVHKKNHPDCNTLLLNLPCDIEEVDNMVNDGCHIHASPSCQKLSQANRVVKLDEASMAEDLVICVLTMYIKCNHVHGPLNKLRLHECVLFLIDML